MSDINSIPNVKSLKDDWAFALMTKGLIVKLSISSWRGSFSLKPDDLGLTFLDGEGGEKAMKRHINLGTHTLMPPEIRSEIMSMEAAARKCLDNYSFKTIWGNFLPYSSFSEWD